VEAIIKSLAENQIVLVMTSKVKYNEVSSMVMKVLNDNFNKLCFAAFNKPYASIRMKFLKDRLDLKKFEFIDILTGTVATPSDENNVVFVRSANALTDLGLAITACMNGESEILIFDSISTLLIYNPLNDVENFLHHIITKTRVSNRKMVLISLKEESDTDLIKDLYVFVDDVVNMGD